MMEVGAHKPLFVSAWMKTGHGQLVDEVEGVLEEEEVEKDEGAQSETTSVFKVRNRAFILV